MPLYEPFAICLPFEANSAFKNWKKTPTQQQQQKAIPQRKLRTPRNHKVHIPNLGNPAGSRKEVGPATTSAEPPSPSWKFPAALPDAARGRTAEREGQRLRLRPRGRSDSIPGSAARLPALPAVLPGGSALRSPAGAGASPQPCTAVTCPRGARPAPAEQRRALPRSREVPGRGTARHRAAARPRPLPAHLAARVPPRVPVLTGAERSGYAPPPEPEGRALHPGGLGWAGLAPRSWPGSRPSPGGRSGAGRTSAAPPLSLLRPASQAAPGPGPRCCPYLGAAGAARPGGQGRPSLLPSLPHGTWAAGRLSAPFPPAPPPRWWRLPAVNQPVPALPPPLRRGPDLPVTHHIAGARVRGGGKEGGGPPSLAPPPLLSSPCPSRPGAPSPGAGGMAVTPQMGNLAGPYPAPAGSAQTPSSLPTSEHPPSGVSA